jgi:hypothetical protein
LHAGFEAAKTRANEPAPAPRNTDASAVKGKRLITSIVVEYGLPSAYLEPDVFGDRMVIWLPEGAWKKLSADQKGSIEAYMRTKYANWGIGVGRVRNGEVLSDRLVAP